MYKNVLVATDGSDNATKAIHVASKLAAHLDCTLSVVHVQGEGEVPQAVRRFVSIEHLAEPPVIEMRDATDAGTGVAYLRAIGEAGIRRHQIWAALAKKVISDATTIAREHSLVLNATLTPTGDPVTAINAACHQIDADLLVLGRRGVSDLKGLLMGSVTHKILQLATCDVLTVKAD